METFVKLAGLFAGLGFGGAPILSASWVWLKKQILGVSGTGLLGAGTIILTITLAAFGDWKLVTIERQDGSWKLHLEKANARIAQLETTLSSFRVQNNVLKDNLRTVSAAVALTVRRLSFRTLFCT